MVGLPTPDANYKVAVVGTTYGRKRKQDVREALQRQGHKVRSFFELALRLPRCSRATRSPRAHRFLPALLRP